MKIKEIHAEKSFDSRKEETINVVVKTEEGTFSTSSPSGKSKGKYEFPSYIESINNDISVLKNLKIENEILRFEDLIKVEAMIKGKIGANSLYALEASLLKAAAYAQGKPLWKFLNPNASRLPYPVANIIGGGMHTLPVDGKKADFQEFLVIPRKEKIADNVFIIKKAHEIAGNILKLRGARGKINDEGAWSTGLGNEGCLSVLNQTREELSRELDCEIDIGIDCASSAFFKVNYNYNNPPRRLKTKDQIKYLLDIAEKYRISYIEDPLNEEDFSGFRIFRGNIAKRRACLVVGDDLTTSNFERFKQAVKEKSISAIILKPNQIGSLLEIKKIIYFCKKLGIGTIMSHRSGETQDYTIADLAFAWQTDFLKCSVAGKEREIKWNRLIEIEQRLNSGE